MEKFNRFLVDVLLRANESDMENFKLGFVAGVLIFAILAVVVRILFIYFSMGDKRSKGIKLSGENGSVIISASAVSDLVRAVGNSMKHIEVSKVKLLTNKADELYLEVHLVMDGSDTVFGDLCSEFQRRVLTVMKDKFGADCIKSIEVYLDKIVDIKRI